MALTKISRSLLDTGISDSSDATAITIDSSENVFVGSGTSNGISGGTTGLQVSGAGFKGMISATRHDNNAYGPSLMLGKSRNTSVGSNTIVQNGDALGAVTFFADDGTNLDSRGAEISAVVSGSPSENDTPAALIFSTTADGSAAPSERMRIDSSGNVGIGQSSPNNETNRVSLELNDTWGGVFQNSVSGTPKSEWRWSTSGATIFGSVANEPLAFYTNNTERMRIDSSGNLLYDCTNVSQQTDDGIKFISNGRIFTVSGYDNSAQENFSMYSTGASAFRFYVDWGGTIHATSTSISAISDQRLKENIVNLETGLTEVMALKPRRFDWKNGDKINVAGFIAQEVETVLPDLIDGFKNDTIEDAKGVRMGDMIPTLVKAIQEQQEQIESLQQEIEVLKNG